MKNDWQHLADLFAIGFGMVGALIKGIRAKFNASTIVMGMLVAGIMTYATTGIIEQFYSDLSPKIIILISFCVGWVSNEITAKMDEFVGDVYEIFIQWLRNKFTKNKKS
jgi:hypothetical protein